jgi:homeobox protein cut-like
MDEVQNLTISDATLVLDYWKNFDLERRKVNLDKTCMEMREMKTASINGRKGLNNVTKTFRSKIKEEQLNFIPDVLKAYQEEIDQLSRRSKLCENAFLGLYKAMYDAPDPAKCIDSLINTVLSASTYQLEIGRLKAEISQYEEEFQQLKNQDITIRRLEDQLEEFRDQNEEKVLEEVARRVMEIEMQTEQKVLESKEMQRNLEKKVLFAMESMKQAQLATDRAQTQLFEVSSQAEFRASALQAENSILIETIQRLNFKIAEHESELLTLKNNNNYNSFSSKNTSKNVNKNSMNYNNNNDNNSNNINNINTNTSNNNNNNNVESEDALTLQLIIVDLRATLQKKEDSFRIEKKELETQVRDQTQQLVKEKENLNKLKTLVEKRPTDEDFLDLKHELKMMQKIAFNLQDNDDEDMIENNDVRKKLFC